MTAQWDGYKNLDIFSQRADELLRAAEEIGVKGCDGNLEADVAGELRMIAGKVVEAAFAAERIDNGIGSPEDRARLIVARQQMSRLTSDA